MNNYKLKGAITVYLSIILSAVILLSGVLMDIVRIKAAEVQVRRAVNSAALSTLAGYNTKLKNEYGLFALHNSNSNYLSETVQSYLNKNLTADMSDIESKHKAYNLVKGIVINDEYRKVNFIDLFDYQIENLEATPVYNFTENEITRNQIIEYMKYRAPAQFAEDFMDKINQAASSEKYTSAYKQKTVIEKKLGKVEKALKRLQEHINQVNKFEKANYNSSINSNSQLMLFCQSIIKYNVYQRCLSINFGSSETPEEAMQKRKARMQLEQKYRNAEQEFYQGQHKLNDELAKYQNEIQGALQDIKTIQELSKYARQDIENLKAYMEELKSEDLANKNNKLDINGALQQDILKYERLLDSENSQNMASKLNGNYEVISYLQTNISALPMWVNTQTGELREAAAKSMEASPLQSSYIDIGSMSEYSALLRELTSDNQLKQLTELANSYERLPNVVDKVTGGKGNDPRKTTAEAAKKIRKEIVGEVSKPKNIENPKLLPSYKTNGDYPNKIFSENILKDQVEDEGIPKVVDEFEVDFDDESNFVEDGLNYIMNFAKVLKERALSFRDEIYVNEYILKAFRDSVEIKESSTDNKINTSFFEKGEVEYILIGNASEEANKYLVRGQILLIRFGMNTLHIYSDSQKRVQALELATVAAGVTGFGIPIAHNLIMCAWGTAEAFYDLQEIYAGKKVPFIKDTTNWKTDLLPTGFQKKDSVESQGGLMDFDYHDYLRLLLLAQNKETKMNRIEDLIELNMQQSDSSFKLNGCNAYLKVNAQVSIKYWFVTKIFVPSKYKTSSGRHLINVEIWRGY
jgi:hypothetical protein